MLKQVPTDLASLLGGDRKLCFLVGAGISMDPPAGLASARQLMDGIIKFAAPSKAADEIRQIPNLRYENLVEQYRGAVDPGLVFMRYFDELSLASDRQPNSIHRYLAKMLAYGHPVMTTNFDHFIERAVGLDNTRLTDVITPKDFDVHDDPDAITGKMLLYKLHGSNKNPLTGEDTSSTVITTLSALGKGKGDDLFSVEAFKRPLFDRICNGRTLVVIGYSGGDDLDIVPMLSRMNGVKSVVWLSHGPGPGMETYQVVPDLLKVQGNKNVAASQDTLLATIAWALKVAVFKVVGPTATVIARMSGQEPPTPGTAPFVTTTIPAPATASIEAWLASNLPPPSDGDRAMFAGQVFVQNGLSEKALQYYKSALLYYEQKGEKRDTAIHLSLIGAALPPNDGLEYFSRALSIFESLGDKKGVASQLVTTSTARLALGQTGVARDGLTRAVQLLEAEGFLDGLSVACTMLGNAHQFLGELDKARDCYEKAYQAASRIGDLDSIANALESKAQFYMDTGEASKAEDTFKQAIQIHEKLHSKQHASRVQRQLGDLHLASGNFDQARSWYQRALDASQQVGDIRATGVVFESIAGLLAEKGDIEAALSVHDQAKNVFEALDDWYMVALTLANRSDVLLAKGDVDGALSRLNRARELFESLRDTVELPNVLSRIGTALDAKGDRKHAIEFHERALRGHEAIGVKAAVARDISNIGLVHLHGKDYGKALLQYKKALAMFQDLMDQASIAAQLHDIAQLHELQGSDFLAWYYYKLAVQREMPMRNARSTMFRRIDLATVSLKLGMRFGAIDALIAAIEDAETCNDHDRKTALESQADGLLDHDDGGQFLDALIKQCESAIKHKDKKAIRRFTVQLGLHYMDMESYKESADFFKEALSAYQSTGEDDVIAGINEYLGAALANLGNNQEAFVAYEAGARIHERLGNREQLGVSIGCIGNTHYALGKYDEAIAAWTRSLDILKSVGDHGDACMVYGFIGDARLQQKRIAESKEAFQQAIASAEKAGDQRKKAHTLYFASTAFIESGDLQTAIQHLNEAIHLGNKYEDKGLVEKATERLSTLKEGRS